MEVFDVSFDHGVTSGPISLSALPVFGERRSKSDNGPQRSKDEHKVTSYFCSLLRWPPFPYENKSNADDNKD